MPGLKLDDGDGGFGFVGGLPGGFGEGDGGGAAFEGGEGFDAVEAGFDEVVGGGDGLRELLDVHHGAVAVMDAEVAAFVGEEGVFEPEVVAFVPEGGVADDVEGAEGSVLEFEGDDGVDVDFGVAVVHVGEGFDGFLTGDPEEDVDHVAAAVVDLSAAGEGEALAPGAFGDLIPLLAEVAV